MQDIRVHIVDKGRSVLYMRYRDPDTGKDVTRSTGVKLRTVAKPTAAELRDAERVGAKWEAEFRTHGGLLRRKRILNAANVLLHPEERAPASVSKDAW